MHRSLLLRVHGVPVQHSTHPPSSFLLPCRPPQAQGAHDTICRLLGLGGAERIDTSLWRQRIADKWDSLKEVGGCGGGAPIQAC